MSRHRSYTAVKENAAAEPDPRDPDGAAAEAAEAGAAHSISARVVRLRDGSPAAVAPGGEQER